MLTKIGLRHRIAPAIVFVATLLGLIAFGIASALALVTNGVSHLVILLIANSLTGVLVTLAYLQHRENEAQRLRTVNENLQTMRDMNQEVRPVLGVVAFYGKQTKSDYVLKVFGDCFTRMDFIMREVLSRTTLASESKIPPPSGARSTFALSCLGRTTPSNDLSRHANRRALTTLSLPASGPWVPAPFHWVEVR